MKKGSTLFLKIVLIFLGFAVLAGLFWFPQAEGRALNLDLFSIYTDPLVIYSFISAIPVFAGLHQAFKLLSLIDANKAFSQNAINTLRNMKFASLSLIGFITVALLYLRFFVHNEDLAGPTMLGICMLLAFSVIATAAGVFQKLLQNAVDIKSENDLTV